MRELFTLMAEQHGVASCAQARELGLSAKAEATRLANGTLASPFPGVLTAAGAPVAFQGRAMAAALSPGVVTVSHGAAARLHGLDGFEDTETVDVLGRRGAHLHPSLGVVLHYTRGALDDHVTRVGPIPVLSVAATLALLAPAVGIGRTARALDSALRLGVPSEELRRIAVAWRRRGRSGPPALLMLLGRRGDQRFPQPEPPTPAGLGRRLLRPVQSRRL